MALKGMSTTLVIIVAAIVILVTALVVITVFGGGMQNFLNFLNPWAAQSTALAQCQGICQQLCLTHEGSGTPDAYTTFEIKDGDVTKYCGQVTPCRCEDIRSGIFGCSSYTTEATCPSSCRWTGSACVSN